MPVKYFLFITLQRHHNQTTSITTVPSGQSSTAKKCGRGRNRGQRNLRVGDSHFQDQSFAGTAELTLRPDLAQCDIWLNSSPYRCVLTVGLFTSRYIQNCLSTSLKFYIRLVFRFHVFLKKSGWFLFCGVFFLIIFIFLYYSSGLVFSQHIPVLKTGVQSRSLPGMESFKRCITRKESLKKRV